MLSDKDELSAKINLCKEGLAKAKAYSTNMNLSVKLRQEGVEQIKFYNKMMMELLKELYK